MASVREENYMDKATEHVEHENQSCTRGYICQCT